MSFSSSNSAFLLMTEVTTIKEFVVEGFLSCIVALSLQQCISEVIKDNKLLSASLSGSNHTGTKASSHFAKETTLLLETLSEPGYRDFILLAPDEPSAKRNANAVPC